jgi:signal peptidase I
MSSFTASSPTSGALGAGFPRALRFADRASGVVCGLAITLLMVLLVATGAGYRPLIDHSDSMRPAIRAGDVVITHTEPASSIRPGEIVTVKDPALRGRLLTHRVVAVHASGKRIEVLTRGDSNPSPESWSVGRSDSVGKFIFRVPAVGRAMAWMTDRWVRTIVLSVVALLLGTELLRRIWRA